MILLISLIYVALFIYIPRLICQLFIDLPFDFRIAAGQRSFGRRIILIYKLLAHAYAVSFGPTLRLPVKENWNRTELNY